MNFKGFPITLILNGKSCLIIGGGPVAERKVKNLLAAAATITIISPKLTKELRLLVKAEGIKHIKRQYRNGDLNGYFLAIAATGDTGLNKNISIDAEANNILLNIADEPELCDFFLPAIAKSGDLQIAVSTNGRSPALAKWIRQQLEREYGPEYAVWLNITSEYRRRMISNEPDKIKRNRAYEKLLNSDYLEKLKDICKKNPEMDNIIDVDELITKFAG